MPLPRRALGVLLASALSVGGAACGACVYLVLQSDVEVVDPTVRAPAAPPAYVVGLPEWSRYVADSTTARGSVRYSVRSVQDLVLRETSGAALARARRARLYEGWEALPPVRIDLATPRAEWADASVWTGAGPLTADCGSSGFGRKVTGDPWDRTNPPARYPSLLDQHPGLFPPAGSLASVTAGAHPFAWAGSPEGDAVAVVSGAGPLTNTTGIMADWNDYGQPHYLEVFALPTLSRLAGPVKIPEVTLETPCWSPSGGAVVVLYEDRFGPFETPPEGARLVVLPVGAP